MDKLFRATEIFILFVWAIVGFLLWVPLLSRVILAFVATVIMSLYTNVNIATAKQSLEAAVTFYVRGFKLISDAIRDKLDGYNFQAAETELAQTEPNILILPRPPEGYYWAENEDGRPFLQVKSFVERDERRRQQLRPGFDYVPGEQPASRDYTLGQQSTSLPERNTSFNEHDRGELPLPQPLRFLFTKPSNSSAPRSVSFWYTAGQVAYSVVFWLVLWALPHVF